MTTFTITVRREEKKSHMWVDISRPNKKCHEKLWQGKWRRCQRWRCFSLERQPHSQVDEAWRYRPTGGHRAALTLALVHEWSDVGNAENGSRALAPRRCRRAPPATLSCTRLPFAHHLLSRLLSSELEAAGSRWEAPSISVRPLRLFRCSRRREDRALGSTLRRTRRTRAAQRSPGRVLGTGSPPRRGVANIRILVRRAW